ncbi:hypothetical protein SOMG_02328 [Schizosaccharomyces osmophilus]|uniref:Uncharacterized protein n=1 Tax=Schizosaccharomyces osmophilus TaxID=2545709 RepID=A0AAF0AUH1_9SCHI|nr:uncharacterized protein SOMG_02328 [Schizosaccharomyces osmophilus]WBW70849.1 hypothetical protein SOMG_02328 [Schizosaccharomyces osmophilus]
MSKNNNLSDPPAYSHVNVYNVDLEKGLPLYTQQDTNKSPNSGSLQTKEKKDIAMDQLGDFHFFLDERKREASQFLNREFPDNVVVKEKSQRLLSTIIPSLVCVCAISYYFRTYTFLIDGFKDWGNWPLGPLIIHVVVFIVFVAAFFCLHSFILGTVRRLLCVVILMGCVLPFLFSAIGNVYSAIGKIIGMVVDILMYGLGTIICGVGYGLYCTLLACLGLNFVSSTEHTSSPTLPSYQQRDNALAPPPTDTNEEIELQSNPSTQL